MEIREPAWSDFEGVYALRTHRYEEIETDPAYGMGTVDRPPTRGDFAVWFGHLQQSLLDGTGVCVVAEESGRIVGFAWIRRKDEARETRHLGDLTIEVLPGFRGRGIGSALLEHALRRCPGRFEIVHLETLPENAAGRRLYEKFGFVVHGRLPKAFYRAGAYHDFLLMHRVIPPAAGTPARP